MKCLGQVHNKMKDLVPWLQFFLLLFACPLISSNAFGFIIIFFKIHFHYSIKEWICLCTIYKELCLVAFFFLSIYTTDGREPWLFGSHSFFPLTLILICFPDRREETEIICSSLTCIPVIIVLVLSNSSSCVYFSNFLQAFS